MNTLDIKDLVVRFGTGGRAVAAIDHVNVHLAAGSIVGLVGESGSGKSTLARAIVGLSPVAHGEILLDGQPINTGSRRLTHAMRPRRHRVQLVFQDPYASLDPRKSVASSIARALAARPDVLIADEITSALDVSVQAAVLNLVRELQRSTHISVLFSSHNLSRSCGTSLTTSA